jgi:ATP-dependent helicase HrpA
LRQPDVVISEDALFHFYDERIPPHVCDCQSFDGWATKLSDAEAEELCLNEIDLVAGRFDDDVLVRFPDSLDVGDHPLDLEYKFSPGAPDDGLTLRVPVDLLREIDPRRFGWLVPGYLEEKVQALLRGLPKPLRREIVPLTEVAESFVTESNPPGTALAAALSGHLRRARGVDIAESRWREDGLPEHLRMNFSVIDGEGAQVACGRDFADLQRRFAASSGAASNGAPDISKTGLLDWTVGDMQEHLDLRRGARRVRVFPMLEDAGDSVSCGASESRERARALHRLGVRRLFMLANNRELQRVGKNLPGLDRLCLAYALVDDERPEWHPPRTGPRPEEKGRSGRSELAQDILEAGAWRALGESAAEVRSEIAFRRASAAGRQALPSTVAEICELCEEILEGFRSVRKQFDGSPIPGRAESIEDIKRHLGGLVYRGFVSATPYESLEAYPRYLQALNRRIEKLRRGGARDSDKVAVLEPHWTRFVARAKDHAARGRSDAELDRYRWMIEEFRVSLFAQEVGTAYPVSRQRLDGQWSRVAP